MFLCQQWRHNMKKPEEFSEKTWSVASDILFRFYPFLPAENETLTKLYIASRAYEAGLAARDGLNK